jgi:hypothetical protein
LALCSTSVSGTGKSRNGGFGTRQRSDQAIDHVCGHAGTRGVMNEHDCIIALISNGGKRIADRLLSLCAGSRGNPAGR